MVMQIILKDKTTKKPISSVRIDIYNQKKHFFANTNNDGIAEFKNIDDGIYIVKIEDPKYRPFHKKIYISRNSIIYLYLEPAWV